MADAFPEHRRAMRPHAPPQPVDDVYTDDQLARMIAAIRRGGRLMVHWGCELFDDMDDVRRHFTGGGQITHAMVFDRLAEDLRHSGAAAALPEAPLHDLKFRRLLERHYRLGPPATYPAEAKLPG